MKHIKPLHFSFALLFVSIVLTSNSFAFTPPPENPSVSTSNISSEKELTSGLNLGMLKIQFEQSTLPMILHFIGVGKIEQRGDAGDHIFWICYSVKNEKQNALLWLISSGEMGGVDHALSEVIAKSIPLNKKSADCPSLTSNFLPVSFTNGVWLKNKKSEVLKKLGHASLNNESWWNFMYQEKKIGECSDGFDVNNWFQFGSSGNELEIIFSGQTTSC